MFFLIYKNIFFILQTRKRKRTELRVEVDSFLTIYGLVENQLKAYRLNKYLNAYEMLRMIKAENKLKRAILSRRRKAYQGL